jgi:hypothetical protein
MSLPSEPEPTEHMTFLESLPAVLRQYCWLPTQQLTLAFLPFGQGHTAWQVKTCPQTGQLAWNVAHYHPASDG